MQEIKLDQSGSRPKIQIRRGSCWKFRIWQPQSFMETYGYVRISMVLQAIRNGFFFFFWVAKISYIIAKKIKTKNGWLWWVFVTLWWAQLVSVVRWAFFYLYFLGKWSTFSISMGKGSRATRKPLCYWTSKSLSFVEVFSFCWAASGCQSINHESCSQ